MASGMHIDMIEKLGDLDALKRNWDLVYEADPEAHPFLSWAWISSWLASRRLPWVVLAAKEAADDEDYVAFLPLQIGTALDKGRGFYNTLVMGGSYYAAYTGFLCAAGFQERAVPALADRVRDMNWTSLHLDDVYLSPERLLLFLDRFPPSGFTSGKVARAANGAADRDVGLHVRLPHGFDAFLHTNMRPAARRNVRRGLRRLDGGDEFRVTHANAETIEGDLQVLYALWEGQWASANPSYALYMLDNSRLMLAECFRKGSLLLPILWHGGKALAALAILVDPLKKQLTCFLSGRDVAFGNPSPGLMLHADTIRWAIANGFSVYDLGAGNYPGKQVFGPEEHHVERFRVRTRSGRNCGERLDPRSLPMVLARARQLYDAGDIENARIGCRQILAVDPRHSEALSLHCDIRATWSSQLEAAPEDATLDMAFTHHRAGELAEAEKRYRAVLDDDPASFEAAHHLGIVLLQRGEARAADVELRRALEIRPDAASAHCNYGNVLASVGDFDGAIASYDRAIGLEPRHAIAFNNRGNALRRLGRADEALASYEGAITLHPGYRHALDNRAALLLQMEGEFLSQASGASGG